LSGVTVDARVEHLVQDAFGVAIRELGAARIAAELHRAIAEGRDFEAGASECAGRKVSHSVQYLLRPPPYTGLVAMSRIIDN
jgi:AAA+ superfamily predicted ATPase